MYLLRFAIISLFTLGAAVSMISCSNTSSPATLYHYNYSPEHLSNLPKTVIIADINFGAPSRHYLQAHESHIDQSFKQYLNKEGYAILSSQILDRIWQKHTKYAGSLYNSSTGQQTANFKKALNLSLSELFIKQPTLTAVIFTDLIESSILFGNIHNRIAQWDGAKRKIKLKGIGSGSIEGSDWLRAIDGISIRTTIIDRNLQVALLNQGAIQVAQALVVHNKNAHFSRRKDLLNNTKEINSGIALSLHPFITMKNYPK